MSRRGNRNALHSGPKDCSGESFEVIDKRIRDRFAVLNKLTTSTLTGSSRSLIVSGPAGLGKSFEVERTLADWDPTAVNHEFIKGFIRPTGLYRTLYKSSEKGKVVVFDDSDSVFLDEVSLSLLKAVCDTTERRKVCWLAETSMVDEETGEKMPREFNFNGSVIFITNIDFHEHCERESNLAPHLGAMLSRSHYLDLAMKSRTDYLVRIKQVVDDGLLTKYSAETQVSVMEYVYAHVDDLRELSLRMPIKIANLCTDHPDDWQTIADNTELM